MKYYLCLVALLFIQPASAAVYKFSTWMGVGSAGELEYDYAVTGQLSILIDDSRKGIFDDGSSTGSVYPTSHAMYFDDNIVGLSFVGSTGHTFRLDSTATNHIDYWVQNESSFGNVTARGQVLDMDNNQWSFSFSREPVITDDYLTQRDSILSAFGPSNRHWQNSGISFSNPLLGTESFGTVYGGPMTLAFISDSVMTSPVPAPSNFWFFSLGLVFLIAMNKKKRLNIVSKYVG